MNTEEPTKRRRVTRRYSAKGRLRLIDEHAASGLSKKAFCKQRGVNLGTFMGWRNLAVSKNPQAKGVSVSIFKMVIEIHHIPLSDQPSR
ncbi:MAG: transposase-like protein [Kiritimatiellia bacterium]|jgi:transposase-like protein